MKKRFEKIMAIGLLLTGFSISHPLLAASHQNTVSKPAAGVVKSIKKRPQVPATIDINRAGVSTFMRLKGIGSKRAKNIVEYREKNGPFTSINDLSQVKGISEHLVERLLKQYPGKIVVNRVS